jgi:hypothetical protein
MTFGISASTAMMIGGVATIGGALISADAAGKAGKVQSEATDRAAEPGPKLRWTHALAVHRGSSGMCHGCGGLQASSAAGSRDFPRGHRFL